MKFNGTKVMAVAMVAFLSMAGEALAKKPGVSHKEVSGVVNLNSANVQQLDALPGVGAKAAKRIVEQRAKAPFAKLEDLEKVKGFGPKKVQKLKQFITLSGPTTIAVKRVDGPARLAHGDGEGQGRSAPPKR